MDKQAALKQMKEVLEPFALHDLDDVCERLYLDWTDEPMHPATILSMAVEACRVPLGGEDGFGDLSWRIGPHHQGLPWLEVEMEYDRERSEFPARHPLTPEQAERDFLAEREGYEPNGVVWEYITQQLDDEGRADVWRGIAEDAEEAARCQEDATRIEETVQAQPLLLDAIRTNNEQGVDSALDLGASGHATDEQGNTPLHLAASLGHHRMMLSLIHAGAGVNDTNAQGQTPLHLAAARSCAQGCLVLLALNANPKARDHAGRTPIPQPGYEHEPGL